MYTSIDIKTGTEGPAHDPYGYTELTVRRANGVSVTLHEGLGEFVKVNGKRVETASSFPPGATFEVREQIMRANAELLFSSFAGLTPTQARRAYGKLRERCRNCGERRTRTEHGYPGETFAVCCGCGQVRECSFDESAVL